MSCDKLCVKISFLIFISFKQNISKISTKLNECSMKLPNAGKHGIQH